MSQYALAREDAYYNGDFDAIERIIDAEAAGVPLTLAHVKRVRKEPIHYIDPGTGAVTYALEFVAGLTRDEAMPVICELLTNLPVDRRVKYCEYCRYPYRDGSLRNTTRTCSSECKTGIKTLQRRQQRADKALLEGKERKRTKREEHYAWWHEYPFWLDEYEMLKVAWKYEVSHRTELIDFIQGQRELYGEGNRKIPSRKPGSEDDEACRKLNAWTRAKLRWF
ncbi:hypothetical protein ACFSL6_17075 [Paenibacillus thailandensis]|uniref:Uncharacterized protein n=1 Tax=Paenibacillus thailandensis TaxID=393250 RepID=A0ABW5QYS5_9BACL